MVVEEIKALNFSRTKIRYLLLFRAFQIVTYVHTNKLTNAGRTNGKSLPSNFCGYVLNVYQWKETDVQLISYFFRKILIKVS